MKRCKKTLGNTGYAWQWMDQCKRGEYVHPSIQESALAARHWAFIWLRPALSNDVIAWETLENGRVIKVEKGTVTPLEDGGGLEGKQ